MFKSFTKKTYMFVIVNNNQQNTLITTNPITGRDITNFVFICLKYVSRTKTHMQNVYIFQSYHNKEPNLINGDLSTQTWNIASCYNVLVTSKNSGGFCKHENMCDIAMSHKQCVDVH